MTDPVLLRLSPSTLKVYLAFVVCARRGEPGMPFAAPNPTLQSLTQLSPPTVLMAKQELIGAKLVTSAKPLGYFTMDLEPIKIFELSSREARTSLEALDLGTSPKSSKARAARAALDGDSFRSSSGRGPKKFKSATFKGTTLEDRREVAVRACKTLGVAPTGRLVQMAMRKLYALLRDGFTVDDALAVARFSRDEYNRGDRWKNRLNVLYIWSGGAFPALVAAMRAPAAQPKGLAPSGSDQDWRDDLRRRALEAQGGA